jgi:hypothetical protein
MVVHERPLQFDSAWVPDKHVTMVARQGDDLWILLAYRVPREPSTPRIAVWRTLKRLGVGQLGDGLVALPADARTREALEWVAEDVVAAGGSASLWESRATSRATGRDLARTMAQARTHEYQRLTAKAGADIDRMHTEGRPDSRRLSALRRELRTINRRDYFPPPERDEARSAVTALAELVLGHQDEAVRR